MADHVSESQAVQEERVIRIAESLRARAPKLGPNVAPRGPFKLAASNITAICQTHKQRIEAEAYVARKTKESPARDNDEGKGDGESATAVVLDTEVDFTKRTFRICGAKVAGKVEATLRNLESLMELLLTATPQQLEPYASRFASANGIDGDASPVAALREVCGLAYALQVAASHMPGWTGFAGSRRLPIDADTDVTEILDELFGSLEPEPPSAPGISSKSPRGRKKGSARRQGGSPPKPKGPQEVEGLQGSGEARGGGDREHGGVPGGVGADGGQGAAGAADGRQERRKAEGKKSPRPEKPLKRKAR